MRQLVDGGCPSPDQDQLSGHRPERSSGTWLLSPQRRRYPVPPTRHRRPNSSLFCCLTSAAMSQVRRRPGAPGTWLAGCSQGVHRSQLSPVRPDRLPSGPRPGTPTWSQMAAGGPRRWRCPAPSSLVMPVALACVACTISDWHPTCHFGRMVSQAVGRGDRTWVSRPRRGQQHMPVPALGRRPLPSARVVSWLPWPRRA